MLRVMIQRAPKAFRKKKDSLLKVILIGFIFTSACHSKPNETLLKHNPGDLKSIRNLPELWIELPREEIIEKKLHQTVANEAKALPKDDKRNIKVQKILDILDRKARKIDPGIQAPAPRAFVYEGGGINGFVTDTLVESRATIMLKNAATDKAQSLEIEGFDRIYVGENSENIQRSYSHKQVFTLINALAPSIGKCLQEIDRAYTLDKSCLPQKIRSEFNDTNINRLIHQSMVNYVFISTSLIDLMTEDELTAVIAHELGHYYKAQTYTSHSELNYFYDKKDPTNHGKKPQPLNEDHELAKLGKNLLVALDNWVPKTVKIDDQKFHSLIFNAFKEEWEEYYCFECTSCRQIKGLELEGFPFTPLPDNELQKYAQYENLVQSCSEELDDRFADFIPGWLQYSTLGPILKKLGEPSLFSSLQEFLEYYSGKLPQLITENNAPIEKMIVAGNESLGHYTFEQEADEIGLELTTAIGLSAETSIRSILKLLELKQKTGALFQFPGELDYEECKSKYEEGFSTSVPIGDFRDPHHSYCYRIYHINREAVTRGLNVVE